MYKFRLPLFVLGLLLCLSGVSEAKVCFLGGGQCNVGHEYVRRTDCPEHERCDIPSNSAEKCYEGGYNLYKPQECCSNDTYWETCDATVERCEGSVCTGKNSSNAEITRCEKDQCKCKPEYNRNCAEEGKIGYGPSCDGKYADCRCDTSNYFTCDSTASAGGKTCTDSTGTYHSVCTCPAVTTDVWEDKSGDCCQGYADTCKARPSGTTYYKCKSWSPPSCVCGYTYVSGKPVCINGCTDGSYNYKGSSSNVTCDSSSTNLANTGICGNNCRCSSGFWDYNVTCNAGGATVCADLGYTETSCEDDYLACPFDTKALICLKGGVTDSPAEIVCTYADKDSCETANANANCTSVNGCNEPTSCKTDYCSLVSAEGALSCNWACDVNVYKYASQLDGADMTGECTGYLSNDGSCSSTSATTRWSGFTCKQGYRLNSEGTGCELDCTYADEIKCEEDYPHSECTEVDGCYEPTGCKVPYVSSCDDSSELAEPDDNGCGYCDCPEGTRHFEGIDFCVPVFSSCEQAGLVTPTTAEKLFCGDGIIVIRDVLGRELKCYETRCKYYEYVYECTESYEDSICGTAISNMYACKKTFANSILKRYEYTWNVDKFGWDKNPTGYWVEGPTRLGVGSCTSYTPTLPAPRNGEANMGGGGGSTAACSNQKKTAIDLLDQTYTSKIETLQRETLINAGIYYMDTSSCTDSENYFKAGSFSN